ncbi:MAG: RagB/SusD family nutrient uptake outer membrane protein [Paludibacter sp.]
MKKKILNLIVIAVVIAFSSCNDYLTVSSNSLLSDDAVFSQPDSTKKAIAAIYEIFGENNSYRNRLWLQLGINTDIEYRSGWSSGAALTLSKSDDYIALYSPISTMPDGYSNNDAANPWSRIYQAIERANLAIAGIRSYGKPAAGNDMGHYLGEALTLRAYFYYDLIKWWGDVPARFTPVTTSTIYLIKSNRDTIYNQIIKDLQEASTKLYSANTPLTNTTQRISQDAARGLLARICLSAAGYSQRPLETGDAQVIVTVSPARQKELYTIAREACRDIINAGIYKLDPSFKNIFYEQCQDITTHGRETIWQLPYNMGLRGRMVYNLGLPRDADGKNNSVAVGGQFKIIPSFFYDYNTSDSRRDITVTPYNVKKSATLGVMEQNLSSGVTGFNIAKWRAEWVKTPVSGTDDGVSPIVLRYADVLLMFAEADLYLNGNEGQDKFDEVRSRAFKMTISDYKASPYFSPLTLDNIKQERAFEFCGENIRKYDLERWGELKSKMDQAAGNMRALRDATGNYATIPGTIYYKYTVDNTISTGERVLTIYGLNPGETDDKTATDVAGGWTKKQWTSAISGTDYYLSENFITHMYVGNPDKKQLLPIMHQIISVSNGSLFNDYGYDN